MDKEIVPNPLAERFIRAIRVLSHFHNHITPHEIVAELSVNQLRTLLLIYETPGINQKNIAKALGVTAAAVSIGIKSLADSDLVEKQIHQDDARIVHLILSTKGHDIASRIRKHQLIATSKFLDLLPKDTQNTIIESIEQAVQTYENQSGVLNL